MDAWGSLGGFVHIEITSPEPQAFISKVLSSHIELYDLYDGNDLTLSAKLRRSDLKAVRKIADHCDVRIRIIERLGLFWNIQRTVMRPLVVLCITLLLVTVFYFPGRVFFVKVQGNDHIPTNLILSCAQECGIGFGAIRSEVRSERVKNMLLAKIPQIQWVGVNTQGCVAVISVRESTVEETEDQDYRVRSIVASCDAVVDQCTVYQGNALCKPGMAVKEGQVLVSGFTDCGITIQATRANAEIYGTTKRDLQVFTPVKLKKRTASDKQTKKFSLIIGKKQINFYKGSGISDGECVKMKMTKYISLPGGFQLPVALVTQWVQTCDDTQSIRRDPVWMEAYAQNYLLSKMVSGRILNSSVTSNCSEDICHFSGSYDCYEIIGIPKYEETME